MRGSIIMSLVKIVIFAIPVILVLGVIIALAIVLPIVLSKKKSVQATEAKPVDKTCENCGAVVSADQKFCDECGTPVKSDEAEENKQ